MNAVGIAVALGVCLAATAANAGDVVIFEQSGTTDGFFALQDLPGPGDYRIEVATTHPAPFFHVEGYLRYHWDVFYAPPPRPHEQYIEGNTLDFPFDLDAYLDVSGGWLVFTVPATTYTFFTSDNSHLKYGVPLGSELYQEDKWDRASITFYAEPGPDGSASPYAVRIVHLNAVPEPESWAVMILGFGVAGAVLRRRERFEAGAIAS
jgi:hypothetical protein